MNNNDYKWETVGRCKFYTDGTTCTDIEVMDDAKEISFIYPKIMINREKCQKVFSSVETLLIGRNVISIVIPNKMFPNIKQVKSKSSSFIDSKYLIERAGGKLLNVFGQSEDAEIDFTLFNRIGSYAFEGCCATKVPDSEDVGFIRVNSNAFFGSGFMNQPFVNGIKCVESFVIDVDETADEIIMPKTWIQYFPDKLVKCMRLPNIRCIESVPKKPRKVIIEDESIRHDNEVLYQLHESGIEEFESRIPRYKTVDGILYSADMKTLVLCPKEKTGEVIIPDGVARIRRNAFCMTKISRVVFPDSLIRIEDEAFYKCKNLKEVDFGNGIKQLGTDGKQLIFSGCAFEKLVFPPQIKEIGISAFSACRELKEVVFNEGLERIATGAFKDCMALREVNLPASIRELGKSSFVCIPNNHSYGDLHINMTTIPDGLAKALVYYGSLRTLRCIYVHIDNANGVYDFVLPDSITSIRNGYSEIALEFNMLADTEYVHNTRRLETAFHYAASSRYECIVAYKTYLKTKHKAAKEFLEKEQYRVAAAIIEELDEKDFVDFVKLRCINLEYDSCIMKRLQEKNWNIALAYMLEEGKGKTKDVLVI